jgi:hypothetical protein
LAGGGATALAGLAGWLLLRRRRFEDEEPAAETEAEPMPVPPRSVAPSSPPPPARMDPFELTLQPTRIQFTDVEIHLDCELLIGNTDTDSADAIRISVGMISANPQQDLQVAAFQAGAHPGPSADPFDLASGAAGRMPIRLSLARENVHVVTVSGRPMFVPLVLIDVRWRGGLSIRRFGASFMAGTGGQDGKLGPIWLDRAAPSASLAANRYFPKTQA